MLHTNLIEQLGKPWLIDQRYAAQYMPILKAYFETGNIPVDQSVDYGKVRGELRMHALSPVSNAQTAFRNAVPGSIAVIPIKGVLMKDDGLCSKGTATIVKELQDAKASHGIKAIILKVDSGGGAVDGTETLANEIANSDKPIVTFVDGVMGSAAYWVGSQSDEVIMSGESSSVGSIGTMISHADATAMYEAAGIVFHDVRATKSTDKNEEFYQMLEGNYTHIQQNILDPLNEVFLGSVKKARGKKIKNAEEVFTGKMFFGKAAVSAGLADSIGNFDLAIQRANDLSKNVNSQNMDFKAEIAALTDKVTAIAELLKPGAKATEGQTDAVAKLQEVEAALSGVQSEVEKLGGVQAELEALKASSSDEIAALTSAKEALEAEKVELEAAQASNATVIEQLKAENLKLSGDKKHEAGAANPPAGKETNSDLPEAELTPAQIIQKNAQFLANLNKKQD